MPRYFIATRYVQFDDETFCAAGDFVVMPDDREPEPSLREVGEAEWHEAAQESLEFWGWPKPTRT